MNQKINEYFNGLKNETIKIKHKLKILFFLIYQIHGVK